MSENRGKEVYRFNKSRTKERGWENAVRALLFVLIASGVFSIGKSVYDAFHREPASIFFDEDNYE